MKYLCDYCSKYPCTDDEYKLMFRCPEFSPKSKPMTNYDRLISKTPEELAEWIESIEPAACPWRDDHGENCPYTDCLNCWISWLKAQAEEGEG